MTSPTRQIGNGPLGLRPGLRLREELLELSTYDKRLLVEGRPALEASDWSLDTGATYLTPFEATFRDVRLDVVASKTLLDAGLVQAESLDICRATPGTFFYDIDLDPPTMAITWDDGFSIWDGVAAWDDVSFLYVHLFDGSNPDNTRVIANLGFHFGTRAEVQARLGPEKLVNGDFENDVDFFGWTLGPGSASLVIDTVNPLRGTKSARWDLNATSGNNRELEQTFEAVALGLYRLSGLYTIGQNETAELEIQIEAPSGRFIVSNGRDTDASAFDFVVPGSGGRLRRFVLDFLADETGTYILRFNGIADGAPVAGARWDDGLTIFDANTSWDTFGSDVGVIKLDNASIKRIYRFPYHEPLISRDNIPELVTGASDVYRASQQIGQASIGFANGGGYFDEALAEFSWESQEMLIRAGGAFPDGEELLIDDYEQVFKGLIRDDSWSDTATDFSLEDTRTFVTRQLPVNTYRLPEFASANPEIIGDVRPLWAGAASNITPKRVDLNPDGFGIYELADATELPNGIVSIDTIFAYADEQAASSLDPTRRVPLVLTVDYIEALPLARFTIISDVGPFVITPENNAIDFDIGGGPIAAFLTPGTYTADTISTEATTAIGAVGAGDESVTYDKVTKKFTFAKGAGTFSLLTSTGSNSGITAYGEFGFDLSSDKTGSLSYPGDFGTFTGPEADHILRVDGVGSRDTVPGGDFTGVSGDPIQKGPDIVRVLWELGLNQPRALIDEDSFVAARSSAPQPLGIYLNEATTFQEVFKRIQDSNKANIVIDGEGVIRFIVNVPGDATGARVLNNNEFISFSEKRGLSSVHGEIRINFFRDPSRGTFLTAIASDDLTGLLFGRPSPRTFETFHVIPNDAIVCANNILSLSRSPLDGVEFSVKGQLDLFEGQKVIINRDRGVDESGSLQNALFRILMVRKAADSALVNFLVVEDR